jgi:c-di-GMP-binding flagellar brake protein YcgR
MNTIFPIEATRQASVIADAIEDFRPAVATWRQGEGWATFETRFVGMDHRAGELTLQYDSGNQETPEISNGQHISISFRRGRGRCAFDTVVLGRGRASLGSGQQVSTLRLEYPEELSDLQRRTYYRQQVSASAGIAVNLSVVDEASSVGTRCTAGSLLDVSPDGMSIGLSEGCDWPADVDFLVDCTLQLDEEASMISLRARVCSRTDLADGRVRLGLQFVDNGDAASGMTGDFARLLARVRT